MHKHPQSFYYSLPSAYLLLIVFYLSFFLPFRSPPSFPLLVFYFFLALERQSVSLEFGWTSPRACDCQGCALSGPILTWFVYKHSRPTLPRYAALAASDKREWQPTRSIRYEDTRHAFSGYALMWEPVRTVRHTSRAHNRTGDLETRALD